MDDEGREPEELAGGESVGVIEYHHHRSKVKVQKEHDGDLPEHAWSRRVDVQLELYRYAEGEGIQVEEWAGLAQEDDEWMSTQLQREEKEEEKTQGSSRKERNPQHR